MCFKNPKKKNGKFLKIPRFKRHKISSLEQLEKNQEQFNSISKNKIKRELTKKDIINNKKILEEKYKKQEEELNSFLKESLTCNNCNNTYPLSENKIRLCCNGCDKFYCCGIAGKCEGVFCKVLINNNLCRARYCIQCCSTLIKIGETCICKTCK
jgi:uncharacterized protein YbaR (Trm112 family)